MANNSLGAKAGIPIVVPVIGVWTDYTPTNTQGFGTISSNFLQYRRVGDSIDIRGRFTAGTTTGSTAQLGLPTGLTIGAASYSQQGRWYKNGATGANVKSGPLVPGQGNTYLEFAYDDYTTAQSPFTSVAGSTIQGGSAIMSVWATGIPIAEWLGSASVAYGAGTSTGSRMGLVQQTPQTALTVTSAQAGYATTRAVGIAYTDINGAWRAKGNLSFTITSATVTGFSLAFSGTVFKTGPVQAVAGFYLGNGTIIPRCYITSGAGTITVDSVSANTVTGMMLSFDVELDSKPTWA